MQVGDASCMRAGARVLAVGCRDGRLVLDVLAVVRSGARVQQLQLVGHSGAVLCVDLDAAEELLASASVDGTVRVWRLASVTEPLQATCAAVLQHTAAVRCVAFDAGGARVATGCLAGVVRVWPAPRGPGACEPATLLRGHAGGVRCVAFHPSQPHLLASGSVEGDVRVWDVPSGSMLWARGGAHGGSYIAAVCFEPKCSPWRLLTLGADGKALAWGPEGQDAGQHALRRPNAGGDLALALSPCGGLLAVGTRDGRLLVLRLVDGAAVHHQRLGDAIQMVAWRRGGGLLLCWCLRGGVLAVPAPASPMPSPPAQTAAETSA
jgi:WD40 repeat protein